MSILFQYRHAYKSGVVGAQGEFNADIDVGASLTYKWDRVTYGYNRFEKREPSRVSLALGPFLGVTRIELNKNNTGLAQAPLAGDEKRHIGVISAGVGLTTDIRGLQVGLFAGRDLSRGDLYDKWDYRKRTWYGIGFGYGLALLSKPSP